MVSQAAPELDQTPPVKLSQQTKFMQNYRIASTANAGTEVMTVANGNGDVELFTVGSDGAIWNFYPDPTSATGYSSTNTGLTGTVVSAGVNGAGHIVVFAAQGLVIGYVAETGATGGARWSAPATCPVPVPSRATSIAKIDAEQIGNHLMVAALVASSSPLGETLYHLVYSDWPSSGAPSFNATPTQLAVTTMNAVWTGSTYANAAYTILDTVAVVFTLSTQQIALPAVAGTFSTTDVDTAVDSSGNNQTFAILNDGNVYHLIGGSSGVPLSWAQLSTLQSFKQIRAVTDDAGAVHVFLLGINNRIYHMEPDTSQMSGYLPPSPIFASTAQMGVARNAKGEIDLFAVGSAQNVITHLFEQEASGDWASQRLEVSTGGKVEDFSSYTTDAQVLDAAGAPLANTPVTVWASEETRLTINGSTYFCGPRRPARLNTNDGAVVSLAQEVDSLSAPTIFISVPSLMTPGDSVAVEQFTDVQNRLKTTTGNDLMAANDAKGQPILNGQYRTQETADAVASAVNNCMSMAVSALRASPSPRHVHAKRSSPGASHHAGDKESATRIHLPSVPQQHWRLSFDGPNARFESLTADEANVLIMQKRATLVKSMGFFEWLEDVGDFISGVASGIVSIVDTVITTVVGGIKAVITFVVDGVTYLFETVVHLIEQAIDLAELVFAKVKIFFEQLYEWLAFLFNWGDILRTHEAVAYTTDQMLGFLGGAAAGLETIVDNGIIALQQNVETWFQNAINNIAGTQSIGGYADKNEPSSPEFSSATSNNIIYNHVIDNGSSATSTKALMRLQELDSPIEDFLTKLKNLADFTKSTQAFQRALTYFEGLGGSPDQIFKQGLAGLMSVAEGLVQAVLSGVRLIIDALFELIQAVIKILRDSLNAEWDIPFVSQFYHWLTDGSPLSTIDLVALIVAIPTTIFYKAMKGAAPFPDKASVDAFKAAFNAQTLLAASGLGPKKRALAQAQAEDKPQWTGCLPKELAYLSAAGGMIAAWFSYGFSAVLDLAPPTGSKPPKFLTYGALVSEVIVWGFSTPWFFTAGPPSCTDADGRGKVLWIIQGVGIGIDAAFVYKDEVLPENDQDWGVTVSLIYAVCHLGAAIGASVGASGVTGAANILAVVPELSKFLRYTSIVNGSKTVSLVVLAGIEGVVGFVASLCGLFALIEVIDASKSQAESPLPVAAN